MEDYRKIIKFGKSSYVVSLPTDWVKRNKLEKGDSLFINENLNNELVFNPRPFEGRAGKKQITIHIDGKDKSRIKREIVSAYLNNYNIIKTEGDTAKYGGYVRDAIKNLMALEIVDENSKEIIAKDFLDLKEVTFEEIIRKIDTITKSMMLDVKTIDGKGDSENLMQRDEQINRLVYLIMRTMRFTLDNPGMANKKNLLKMTFILNVWDITLNIEKIADDVKRAARHFSRVKSKKSMKGLLQLFGEIEKFYWDTMRAYYEGDIEKSYALSLSKRKLSDKCNEMHEIYWGERGVPVILENFKNMISSTHNIGRRVYS